MDLENLSSCYGSFEKMQKNDNQKISVSDQNLDVKSDSFTVDMEPFSPHANKDLAHGSRFNLERSLSRKGSQVRPEKKMNSYSLMNDGDRDTISTPKDSLMADTKWICNQNTDHHTPDPQVHHQITIITGGNATTTKPAGTPTKSSLLGKRSSSFKQLFVINPRRILFFFATLSSVGTILLICLTLSMANYE